MVLPQIVLPLNLISYFLTGPKIENNNFDVLFHTRCFFSNFIFDPAGIKLRLAYLITDI
jgi:hypothetical protein